MASAIVLIATTSDRSQSRAPTESSDSRDAGKRDAFAGGRHISGIFRCLGAAWYWRRDVLLRRRESWPQTQIVSVLHSSDQHSVCRIHLVHRGSCSAVPGRHGRGHSLHQSTRDPVLQFLWTHGDLSKSVHRPKVLPRLRSQTGRYRITPEDPNRFHGETRVLTGVLLDAAAFPAAHWYARRPRAPLRSCRPPRRAQNQGPDGSRPRSQRGIDAFT
jgi:hypothetical protein